MATYALLMLLTLAVSFLAVMVYRRFSSLRISTVHTGSLREESLVSLSQGSGQWSVGLQHGFVHTKKRVPKRRVSSKAGGVKKVFRKKVSEGSVKRPWGW